MDSLKLQDNILKLTVWFKEKDNVLFVYKMIKIYNMFNYQVVNIPFINNVLLNGSNNTVDALFVEQIFDLILFNLCEILYVNSNA